ncbi:class I SAM-dependent methyltransferase [Hoeflea sp.]|uniref:class I SAM-dependent methyltransferase n=1 Tax=Hoeflea sp. TaxID=1940281 RepID=UPI003B02C91D
MKSSDFSDTEHHYDEIAQQWADAKSIPYIEYILTPSLLKLIGPVDGKTVLDLACGEGADLRHLKKLGAADVLGVDISHEMIHLARNAEKEEPLGCRYLVGDAAQLQLDEQFDLVIGAFLLNHASSKEQLLSLFSAIAGALTPGGRFVGLNVNMAIETAHYDDLRKYGRWMTTTPDRKEGDMIVVHHRNPDGSEMIIENFYLSPETYAAAAAEAGLKNFRWLALSVSQAGLDAYPPGFWDEFFETPQVMGIAADL